MLLKLLAEESYIEIYEASYFAGQKYVLFESNEFLTEFNDRASSFKVRTRFRIFVLSFIKVLSFPIVFKKIEVIFFEKRCHHFVPNYYFCAFSENSQFSIGRK